MKRPMSEKSPGMVRSIEKMFPGTLKSISEDKCPTCLKPIRGFRDNVSVTEYEISGMCQKCQDKVFGK